MSTPPIPAPFVVDAVEACPTHVPLDVTWFDALKSDDRPDFVRLIDRLVGELKASDGRWYGVVRLPGDGDAQAVVAVSAGDRRACYVAVFEGGKAWISRAGRASTSRRLAPQDVGLQVGDRVAGGGVVTRVVDNEVGRSPSISVYTGGQSS